MRSISSLILEPIVEDAKEDEELEQWKVVLDEADAGSASASRKDDALGGSVITSSTVKMPRHFRVSSRRSSRDRSSFSLGVLPEDEESEDDEFDGGRTPRTSARRAAAAITRVDGRTAQKSMPPRGTAEAGNGGFKGAGEGAEYTERGSSESKGSAAEDAAALPAAGVSSAGTADDEDLLYLSEGFEEMEEEEEGRAGEARKARSGGGDGRHVAQSILFSGSTADSPRSPTAVTPGDPTGAEEDEDGSVADTGVADGGGEAELHPDESLNSLEMLGDLLDGLGKTPARRPPPPRKVTKSEQILALAENRAKLDKSAAAAAATAAASAAANEAGDGRKSVSFTTCGEPGGGAQNPVTLPPVKKPTAFIPLFPAAAAAPPPAASKAANGPRPQAAARRK